MPRHAEMLPCGIEARYAASMVAQFPELAPMFWQPGDRIQHVNSDRVVTIDRRKDDNSGWWMADSEGGLWDAAAVRHWRKVEAP